jgi:hypothetical protein
MKEYGMKLYEHIELLRQPQTIELYKIQYNKSPHRHVCFTTTDYSIIKKELEKCNKHEYRGSVYKHVSYFDYKEGCVSRWELLCYTNDMFKVMVGSILLHCR